MRHLLFSQDQDMPVVWFDKYDKEVVKKSIVEYLLDHPSDVLEHCEEFSETEQKKYVGYDIINFYQNQNNKPCRVVLRGNREFYKPLS